MLTVALEIIRLSKRNKFENNLFREELSNKLLIVDNAKLSTFFLYLASALQKKKKIRNK